VKKIRLVGWREEENKERAGELRASGYPVECAVSEGGALFKEIKEDPPEALIIDLSRSPAHGRDLAVALRIHKGTRHVPLVFAGGTPEKVARVREVLPDAEFADWREITSALDRVLSGPVADPVVPETALAGYSGTPLPKKLGIKDAARVLLVRAPDDFLMTLGHVPDGVTFLSRFSPNVDLILWFVRSRKELGSGVGKWASRVGKGGIWIIWPKKGSELDCDLKQNVVRRTGLDEGLVDYKIAAVDQTWSGLKFSVRKKS
jgi:hypothetical protein